MKQALYREKQGAWVAGVCRGLEESGRGSVIVYRLLFVLFTSLGLMVYAYLALTLPTKQPDGVGLANLDSNLGTNKAIRAVAIIFGSISCLGLILALVGTRLEGGSPSGGEYSRVKVGEKMYIGKSNCDKAIKNHLTDPGSYERIDTQIIDVKAGEGWVAETHFRARNGFGGYQESSAQCLFDGREYRALLN
jgi:phage shock protein PspC (stress-responsive transcriptional regulator)